MEHITGRRAKLAAEIRAELARQNFSTTSLSVATGISLNTLRRRLNGVQPFWFEELDAISHALSVPLPELIARTEDAA